MAYLRFSEVIMVRDQGHRHADDLPVYERELRGERILTLDGTPSRYGSEPRRYGTLYYDAQENACIVPDEWNEDDAWGAKGVNDA